jgi:hypothetical protein
MKVGRFSGEDASIVSPEAFEAAFRRRASFEPDQGSLR